MEKSGIPVENQSLQKTMFFALQKPKVFERFLNMQKSVIFAVTNRRFVNINQQKD